MNLINSRNAALTSTAPGRTSYFTTLEEFPPTTPRKIEPIREFVVTAFLLTRTQPSILTMIILQLLSAHTNKYSFNLGALLSAVVAPVDGDKEVLGVVALLSPGAPAALERFGRAASGEASTGRDNWKQISFFPLSRWRRFSCLAEGRSDFL